MRYERIQVRVRTMHLELLTISENRLLAIELYTHDMLQTTPNTFVTIFAGARHASTSLATRPSRRVPLRRLALPLVLVSAVSSLAINVRNSRDTLEQLESSHSAQRSVLLDLVDRLEKGNQLSADQIKRDFERVGIIQRQLQKHERSIGWKETIFGRRKTAEELAKEQEEIDQIEECVYSSTASAHSLIRGSSSYTARR